MSNAPTGYVFRHPDEAEQRSTFSLGSEITVENFRGIIGATEFTEDTAVRCQIRQPQNTFRCSQTHWNGWVAVNDKGEEGYIGSVCGDRDLQANALFAKEKSRVRAEIRLSDYVEILGKILSDRRGYERRAQGCLAKLEELQYKTTGIKDSLPRQIMQALRSMGRTGNAPVGVRFLQIRRDEDDVEKTWTPHTVGNLRGVSLFDYATIYEPRQQAQAIMSCLSEVQLDRSAGIKNLKEWSETLGSLDTIERATDAAEVTFSEFTSPNNLKLLLLLEPNEGVREQVALFILRRDTEEFVSKAAGRRFVVEFDKELRAIQKNDGIRIALG